jgi:Flp pilus assembly pilin Flp
VYRGWSVGSMHRSATEFAAYRMFPLSKAVRLKRSRERVQFRLIGDARGVTAIEYTLIAALIAMAFVALITQIGDFVSIPFDTLASQL